MENNDKWNGNIQAPANACQFILEDAVKFAQGDKKGIVKLIGYRGSIINHWYWGNLAFDFSGLHFDKPRTPGLIDHDTSKRLTYSTSREIEPETYITGPFLENANAQELANDIKEGFPFQASLSLIPEIVEQVAEGQSVEVNGNKLKGPGAVFRKAAIMEISAVVFGAFSNTESTALSDNNKNVKFEIKEILMPKTEEKTKLTLDQFKTENTELHEQVFAAGIAEGEKKVTDRFERLKKVCDGDNELLVNCFAEGIDTADAMQKKIEKLSADNTELKEKLSKPPAVKSSQKIDPAVQEFSDKATEPGKETGKFDEQEATDDQLKEHFGKTKDLQDNFSCAEAYIAAVRHPEN